MFLHIFIVSTGKICGNGAEVFMAGMSRTQESDHVRPRAGLNCPCLPPTEYIERT